jgi:hypothetical protein
MRASTVGGIGLTLLATGTAIAARRRADHLAAERFYELAEPTMPPREAASNVTNPSVFHRSEAFYTIHAAQMAAVRDVLPTADLRPVRFPGDRALVALIATRYHEWTCANADGGTIVFRPFGEVAVAAFVTRWPAPAVLPVLPGMPHALAAGLFWLHIPNTSGEATWAGRILGEPKFVADIDFTEDVVNRGVHVAEGGREILAFSMRVRGGMRVRQGRQRSYSAHRGLLLETVGRGFSYEQRQVRPKHVELEFGDHVVGQALRQLGIEPTPLIGGSFLASRWVAPETDPRVVGRSAPYLGYEGTDRPFGRYTVQHPGTEPVDQYADPATAAPRMGPIDFVPPWERTPAAVRGR